MIRRLLLGLAFCLFAVPSWAAIGTVTSLGCNQTASATSLVLTTVANISTGDLVVVLSDGSGTSRQITALVDSNAVNTYHVLYSQSSSSTKVGMDIAVTANATAVNSGGTITATYNGAAAAHGLCAFKVSGMVTDWASVADFIGAEVGSGTNTGGTPFNTTTITSGQLSQTTEVVVGIVGSNSNYSATFPKSPNSPFAALVAASNLERLDVFTATTAAATSLDWFVQIQYASSNQIWGAQFISFKGAVTGASSTNSLGMLGMGQ